MASQNSVASRALALSTYFLSGVLSINLSQFMGAPLRLIDEDWYNAWIAFTKQSFGLLTMSLTQSFAPTTVVVSGDSSVRGQMRKGSDGSLQLNFPHRIIMVANHQIYTDWLYLWWIAYCNKMHGSLYIILKESLKRIPVIGWGMQLSQFIFLKRDWAQDKPHMAQALQRLNKARDPMWLLLFPEGTNLAPDTRLRSLAWAQKNGIPDCQHLLLPRSTGLQFCLQELEGSVQYLYDCTIAYAGVSRGQYAQDVYSLKAGYLQGKPPKRVGMYWRRFAIKDIPIHNEKVFGLWLTARWREKDLLIENFHRFGRFPSDVGATKKSNGVLLKGCGLLSVQIKPSQWYEFLQIFAPMGVLAMVLYIFYGALPRNIWKSINEETVKASANELKHLEARSKNVQGVSGNLDLDGIFSKNKQGETFQRLATDLVKRLQTPEAKSVIDRANLVQRWLEDPQKFVSDHLEGEMPKSQSFLQALKEEEERRKGQQRGPHQGTFWNDMEKLAASRSDRRVLKLASPIEHTSAKPRQKPAAVSRSKPVHLKNGSFWNDMKSEEDQRRGSIFTSSSINSETNSSTPRSNVRLAKPRPPKLIARSQKANSSASVANKSIKSLSPSGGREEASTGTKFTTPQKHG